MEEVDIQEVRLTPQTRTEIDERIVITEEALDPFQQVNLFPPTAKIPYRLLRAFLSLSVTPPLLQLLEHLFQEGRVDPTEGLIEYALRVKDEWDLYAVALCLRYQANPNVYVVTNKNVQGIPKDESVHLLAAFLITHNGSQEPLLIKMLTLLRLHGLDVDYPFFSSGNVLETKSVREWLGDSFYLGLPESLESMELSNLLYYAALSGRPEDFFRLTQKSKGVEEKHTLTESEYAFMVKSRTYNLFAEHISFPKVITVVEVDSLLSVLALQYYNEKALEDYVRYTALISYLLTNELCLRCEAEGLLGQIWARTLILCVRYGLQLDLYQYEMIKNNKIIQANLEEEYNLPYWQKFLREPKQRGLLPLRVYNLAIAICGNHFDLDLSALTQAIENVEKTLQNKSKGLTSIEEAIARRERLKILANKGCLDLKSFSASQNLELVPLGEGDRVENPLLLMNEYRLLFQNHGVLYVVYSFDYTKLTHLPEFKALPQFAQFRLLDKVDENLDIIAYKGGSPDQPKTYINVIQQELAPDKITNTISEQELSKFFVALGGYLPVPFNVDQFYNGIYNLHELTPEHRRISIAYLYHDLRVENERLWQSLHDKLLSFI